MQYDFFIHNDRLMCNEVVAPYTGNVNTYQFIFKINTHIKGLQWFCVFKQGEMDIVVPIIEDACSIPPEVLQSEGLVHIGCYATNGKEDDFKRLSTNWLMFQTSKGAYTEGTAPETPTPDLWEMLIFKTVPYIGDNGNWFVYDIEKGEYIDSGLKAQGHTPEKGIDYWTYADKKEVQEYIDEQTEIIRADVEGLQEQLNTEAHFKGYLSTNAKIQALEATPNDFAYSAESGTKWIYDAVDGWQDTGVPVPDQLTPASDTMPLINGTASVGTEEAYARGDHRHPTDTTRASAAELNDLKDIKADKTTIEVLEDAEYSFEFSNTHNKEKRLAEVSSISFTFGDGEYPADYISNLSFNSGATPTAIDYTDSGILNWVGTDCTNADGLSIFQPSANTHYDIVFYFNGAQFIGLVNGFVPATGNEAV